MTAPDFLYLLRKSFIAPFQSKGRTLFYLCALLGNFGFFGTFVYFSFDYTGVDLSVVISFLFTKMAFSNLFFLPLLFMLLKRFKGWPVYITLLLMQLLAISSLFLVPDILTSQTIYHSALIGIIFSLISEPFWAVFHALMVSLTTDDNRGHEVAMAELGLKMGIFLGSIGAGFMVTFMPGAFFPVLAMLSLVLVTVVLSRMLWQQRDIAEQAKSLQLLLPYKNLLRHPWLVVATIITGIGNALNGFYTPVWMKFIGFSAVVTGSLMGAQVIIRMLISPWAGHLFEKQEGEEIRLGAGLYGISWLPWLAVMNSFVFIVSSIIWTLSAHLLNVGLNSRWYEHQTLESMATREICLAIGRLLALILIVPTLLISPIVFFVLCGLVGVGLYFHGKRIP